MKLETEIGVEKTFDHITLSPIKDTEDWSSEDQQTMKNQEKFSIFDARFPIPKNLRKNCNFKFSFGEGQLITVYELVVQQYQRLLQKPKR